MNKRSTHLYRMYRITKNPKYIHRIFNAEVKVSPTLKYLDNRRRVLG
jgi:hypothetical protein